MRRLKASTILFAALLVTQPVLAETPETTDKEKPVAAETSGQPPAEETANTAADEPKQTAETQSRTVFSPSRDDICQMIEAAAAELELPFEFFARLIWQESRFNPYAVSRAGAQGIAQFMPKTASGRGLQDPFEPAAALHESAEFLRELQQQFGNIGLAAAAYNAGPGRVQSWLKRRASLPRETQNYVQIITGHSAEKWAAAEPPAQRAESFQCTEMAKLVVERRNGMTIERLARAAFERLILPYEAAERRATRNGILGKHGRPSAAETEQVAKLVQPRGRTQKIIKITAKANNRPRVEVIQVAMRGAKDARPDKVRLADQRRVAPEPQRNGKKRGMQMAGSLPVTKVIAEPAKKTAAHDRGEKKTATRDRGDMRMKYGLGAGKIKVASNAQASEKSCTPAKGRKTCRAA